MLTREERYAGTFFHIILWNRDIWFDHRLWHRYCQPNRLYTLVVELPFQQPVISLAAVACIVSSFCISLGSTSVLRGKSWKGFFLDGVVWNNTSPYSNFDLTKATYNFARADIGTWALESFITPSNLEALFEISFTCFSNLSFMSKMTPRCLCSVTLCSGMPLRLHEGLWSKLCV